MSRRRKIARQRLERARARRAGMFDEKVVVQATAAELSAETDDEIIRDLVAAREKMLRDPSIVDRIASIEDPELAERIKAWDEYQESLLARVVEASNAIHRNTKASKANWVIASPAIAKELDPTGEFSETLDGGAVEVRLP